MRASLEWEWQPSTCDIRPLDPRRLSLLLQGRRVLFAGDSLTEQLFVEMRCVLGKSVHSDSEEHGAGLAQELREIGDGTETIVLYAMRLESSLASNVLSLREQRLLAVPSELFMLTHVEMLDLASNRLKELPGEVCHMTKLKKLYLDHNQLTKLPHELFKIGNTLTLLGISDNPLDPALMQLYLAGLPILLAHLKATRPHRATTSAASARTAMTGVNDVGGFDLFETALPNYAMNFAPVSMTLTGGA